MKVLWDPQVFTWQAHGGISRLFVETWRELRAQDPGVEVIVPRWIGPNGYAVEAGLPQTTINTGRRFPGQRSLVRAFNRRSLKRAYRLARPALVHPTYFDPRFLELTGETPFVLTVFDMVHERFAQSGLRFDRETSERKKRLIDAAARVIAISEATKRDVIDYAGVAAERIDVACPGNSLVPPPALASREAAMRGAGGRPYLLFVGQRPSYKNFATFLQGIANLLISRDVALRCIGGGPLTDEDLERIRALGVADRVTQETLTDDSLALAYRDALLFVFPSLGEGFGIPLLEAFCCGCPVAASDIPVFREVAADAVSYFNPREPESIGAAVAALLDDSALRARVIAAGSLRLRLFSWTRAARDTAATYRKIASAGGR
jgi:glycosyltransferase involved in cell wall biosynthesis